MYKLLNKTKQTVIAGKVSVAQSFWDRLSGLMFRVSLAQDTGLVFWHTNSIHMFFMRFSIDVIFVGKDMKVKKLYHGLKPWRLAGCLGAVLVAEVEAGAIARSQTHVGDVVELSRF